MFCTKGSQCIMGDVGEGNARMLDSARLEGRTASTSVLLYLIFSYVFVVFALLYLLGAGWGGGGGVRRMSAWEMLPESLGNG